MSERKDAKEAEKGAAEAAKQQQAAANSYAMLMPLALPAPAAAGMQQPGDAYGAPPPGMMGGPPPPGYGGGFAGQPY